MSYLKNYGTKNRKFQEGGAMMAEEAPMAPAPGPEAGPEAGGQEEQIMALAEATMQGDQEAAAQLGQLLAPMIMQEVQAGAGGGAPAPGPEAGAQPVFRKGGKFVGTTR